MVRYGELFLKSEPVMQHYIRILRRNLGRALEAAEIPHSIEEHRGRLFINTDDPDRAAAAALLFGVVSTSIAYRCEPTPASLAEAAVRCVAESGRRKGTFAVRARREGVSGFTSQELGATIGSAIIQHFPDLTVDLTNPEYEVFVEARKYGGFVTDRFFQGPGGLPLGTQGKAVCLLSAGIDSPVAAWLMMRRGTEIVFLHMDGGRYAGADTKTDSRKHAAALSRHCMGMPLSLIEVPMGPFFEALATLPDPRFTCLLCKRFMLRIAERIGSAEGCMAIVNGDNLGQVASQTLQNLSVVSPAATLPILRPLLTYDKVEVIELARSIRTYIERPGDHACLAVPKKPATHATNAEVEELEATLPLQDLIKKAVAGAARITALSGSIIDG